MADVTLELFEHEHISAGLIGSIGEVRVATYGTEGCWLDVREAVQAAVAEGREVHVTNDFFRRDPAFGLQKRLVLVYAPRRAGCGRALVRPERPMGGFSNHPDWAMVEAWEGTRLELPEGTIGDIPGACYGAGDIWVSVRDLVKSFLAPDGSLQLVVSNEAMGGDPVPGKRKSVRITYTAHESRITLADCDDEWEVLEAHHVEGIQLCQGHPGTTMEDLRRARRRCLLLGCGGFHLGYGSLNQCGDEDEPPGASMYRATQEELRAHARPRPVGPRDGTRNRALRPGVHLAPARFRADTVWRPGMDPAPAPHITWYPSGRYCAFAMQIRVPPEGVSEATFYMCGGFSHGYAGIQQHSGIKQAVLFSVWNSSSGGTCTAMKDDTFGQGSDTWDFSGEGSGAKGGRDYPPDEVAKWIPGHSYTFLLRAEPDGDATIFTCHFYKPEDSRWHFLARIRRPDPTAGAQGRLGNPGGFLEDFAHTGARRSGEWGPTWVQRVDGSWDPVTRVKVTDGCGRPNKAARAAPCGQRVELLAGGEAMDAGILLFDGTVEAAPVPDFLREAPGVPASSGWAAEEDRAADGRPKVSGELPGDGSLKVMEVTEHGSLHPTGDIVAAIWGAGETWVDVRELVQAAVAQGRRIEATNSSLGGDPVPGDLKYLRVAFRG